ncbi:MAG: hypothetical protein GDA36_04145 [Rhodobacteraceae bacterium]|nr:hypothetical protein [Paracoccaceae bacterium]
MKLSLFGPRPGEQIIRVFNARTAANARHVTRDPERVWPVHVQKTVRTDNGKAFTDRLFAPVPDATTFGCTAGRANTK